MKEELDENVKDDTKEESENSNEKDLGSLIEEFEDFCDTTEPSRKLAQRDRDYVDHDQLSEKKKQALRERGQPAIVFNRIMPKINYLVGTESSNRTSPKVLPRTPKHEGDADALGKALRYVEDETNFEITASETFFSQIVEGTGAAIVEFNPETEEIEINEIPWDRFYWDVYSRKRDFSDSLKFGIVTWMPFESARALVKAIGGEEKGLEIASFISDSLGSTEGYDDKPDDARFISTKTKRVQLFQEYYSVAGVWYEVFFHKGGIIKHQVSPYKDEKGKPRCPIKARSSFVDSEGNRYGIVRGWIGPQDEINDRRSKAIHEMHSNQTIGDEDVVDVSKMKEEKNKPDGHITLKNPNGKFEFVDKTSRVSEQLTMLQEAKNEIDSQGVNAALTGTESRNLSGRALLAKQQGGLTELGKLFDVHKLWKREIYRLCFQMMRQFWGEKWIRITDKPEDIRFAAFNRPVTKRMVAEERAKASGEKIPDSLLQDPTIDDVLYTENDLSKMNVDILIHETPDTATIQQEQFAEISKLAGTRGDIPTRALIKLSSLSNKDDVLQEIEGSEEEKKKNSEIKQKALEIESNDKISVIEKNKASALKLKAEAEKIELENFAKRKGIGDIIDSLT